MAGSLNTMGMQNLAALNQLSGATSSPNVSGEYRDRFTYHCGKMRILHHICCHGKGKESCLFFF